MRAALSSGALAITLLGLSATGAAGAGAGTPATLVPRAASLPAPATGHRPGPDILYAPPAVAPQLTNTGIWTAPSILISGAEAYRSGEFLYQDFLYDDHGAEGNVADQNDPRRSPGGQGTSGDLFAKPGGTYTYPTDPRYANNAADLVEFRVKPLTDSTAFRVTLNTLKDPSLVGISIALGTGTAAVPHGANATSTAAHVLTVHGTAADLDGAAPPSAITVSVDMTRRQFDIRLPHADYDPGTGTVAMAAGVGLWNTTAGAYLIPGMNATATAPGGAGTLASPPAFFNLAFRTNEAFPSASDVAGTAVQPAWWRDKGQGTALAAGSLSAYTAQVDFAKLAAATTDDSAVPTTGALDRILQSHFETEQGADYSTNCASITSCQGELRGNLQPYAIYVPTTHGPNGYGMTLLLHSLSASYNQYLGSHNQSQFGDRSPGSVVITPSGRGTDGWYYDVAGADTFEVWADVAAHYRLDPDVTVITGYSMGGYGTYKFASQFPDLFARAQPTVGPPGLGIWLPPAAPTGGASSNTNSMLASVRNIPFLIWNAYSDELVPVSGPVVQSQTFGSLGYRYEFDLFAPAEHLTLAINDQFAPAATFLGSASVDRSPPHVTYVRNPSMDFAQDGTVADHAYWLSAITLADPSAGAGMGTIDVRSEGFGVGDPTPSGVAPVAGALTGGTLPAISYQGTSQTWGAAPSGPVADKLDVSATNIASVVVDPVRARVSCAAQVSISGGPTTVVLAGCNRAVSGGGPATSAAATGLANTGPARGPGGGAAGLAMVVGAAATALLRRRRPGSA